MQTKKMSYLQARRIFLLLLGSSILAFGLYNVHRQNQITEGGVLGMTLLIDHWLGISPGISGLLMDASCYVLGYRMLGREFLKKALIASVGFSISYNIFEKFDYLLPSMASNPLMSAVVGGIFVGVGVGIVVREGGASGGDDALALIIAKVTKCNISRAYFATDFVVLMLSLSYIPIRNIAFSLVTVTLSSYIIGKLQPKELDCAETSNQSERELLTALLERGNR